MATSQSVFPAAACGRDRVRVLAGAGHPASQGEIEADAEKASEQPYNALAENDAHGWRVCSARKAGPHLARSAVGWENHRLPGTTAFVVELPAGAVSSAAAVRYARAVLTLGRTKAVKARRVA